MRSNNEEKVISMINRDVLYKRKGWFHRYMEKGYFLGGMERTEEKIKKLADTIESFVGVLEGVYGENWAFQFRNMYSLPSILILFPEIDITNSEDRHHTIRNLVVRLSMKIVNNSLYIHSTIGGFRLTVTREEYISGYLHSHLNTVGGNYSEYFTIREDNSIDVRARDFCLGVNEIPELICLYNDNHDIEIFELLLLTLKSFVCWESIEGGPYFRISNISQYAASDDRSLFRRKENDADLIFFYLLQENVFKTFDFDMLDSKVRVIENDFFYKTLYKVVKERCPELFCSRVGNDFFKVFKNDSEVIVPVDYKFSFKNTEIPFKIYNNYVKKEKEEEGMSSSFMIHPITYRDLINRINIFLYERCIRFYTITQ